MGGGEHRCEWRDKAQALEVELGAASSTIAEMTTRLGKTTARLEETTAALTETRSDLAALQGTVAQLQRHVFGRRSEKMPPVAEELRKKKGVKTDPAAALAKRLATTERKKALPAREIPHPILEEKKVCPKCHGAFRPLGPGRRTTIFEYVPPTFEQQIHVQAVERCSCGETIVTAEGPAKVFEKAGYGPAFLANLVVAKCSDSIPLTRQAKQYRRAGIPMNRSTLIELFHRTAEETSPLWKRLVELVPCIEIAQADETTTRVLDKGKTRKAYIWTFLGDTADDKQLVAFQYSPSRSGETPVRVLGDSKGILVIDAFGGYNAVTTPAGRVRVGCLAHVRRKFFDALPNAEAAAKTALELILEIYKVEHEAKERGIDRTAEHLAMRQSRSREVMEKLHGWLLDERPKHLPKSPMGAAITYALNQWATLQPFLENARIPVDNNKSERMLRAAALGKRNWLFVGTDHAGENLAGLYSLVATCEANGKNPVAYLTDVLLRLQTHPASRIDDLLPQNWQPPQTKPPSS